MKSEDIKNVLIAGAGTMGQQITVPCITHGLNVVLYDIEDDHAPEGALPDPEDTGRLRQVEEDNRRRGGCGDEAHTDDDRPC